MGELQGWVIESVLARPFSYNTLIERSPTSGIKFVTRIASGTTLLAWERFKVGRSSASQKTCGRGIVSLTKWQCSDWRIRTGGSVDQEQKLQAITEISNGSKRLAV